MRLVISVFLMAIGFVFASGTFFAQKTVKPKPGPAGSWRLIGQTHARHTADHDSIVVAGPDDNFRRIKLKVTGAALNLQRLVVTYENGEPDNLDVVQNIPKGGESRAIDLRGGKRGIRRIEFWYDTKGLLNGTADISIFGLK